MKRRGDVGGGWSAFVGMLVACAVVAAGCGPKGLTVYPTSGTITYKGQPVAGASVQFMPAKGSPCIGRTDETGKYTILHGGKPGAPVGPCRVTVSTIVVDASMTMPPGSAEVTPGDLAKLSVESMAKRRGPPAKDKSGIPAKYSSVETSGLEAVVTSDASKNVFDFDLQD